MKQCVCRIFVWLSAALCASPALAVDLQRTFVELLAGPDRPYVVASFFRSDQQVRLVRQGDAMVGGADAETSLLRAYYELMMLGRPEEAAELFYDGDGSRDRFLEGLASLPTRYDGYRTLAQVAITEHYGWGPYRIEVVELLGSDGRQQSWREGVVCAGAGCYLTNAIDRPDDAFKLYSEIRNLRGRSPRPQEELARFFDSAGRSLLLPMDAARYPGVRQYPLEFAVQLDRPASAVAVTLPHESGTRVVVDGFDITSLVALLSDLKRIDVSQVEPPAQAPGGAPEVTATDEIEREIAAAVEGRVVEETLEAGFHFVSAFKPGTTFTEEWYHPIAAAQRVNRWASIEVVAFLALDRDVAVFFQPTQAKPSGTAPDTPALREPVQVAVLRQRSGADWRVLLGGAGSRLQVVYSDAVVDVANRSYGDEVTFVYDAPRADEPRRMNVDAASAR